MSTASPCLAIEYRPFDWVPFPSGSNMGYYDSGMHNEFNSAIIGTVKKGTTSTTPSGLPAASTTMKSSGFTRVFEKYTGHRGRLDRVWRQYERGHRPPDPQSSATYTPYLWLSRDIRKSTRFFQVP